MGVDEIVSFAFVQNQLYFSVSRSASLYHSTSNVTAERVTLQDFDPPIIPFDLSRRVLLSNFVSYDDKLYFVALERSEQELWQYVPGQAAALRIDVASGFDEFQRTNSSNADELVVFQNSLYFVADDGTAGRELHRIGPGFDASVDQPQLIDILPGPAGSTPSELTGFAQDGRLYFSAIADPSGTQLWRYDPVSQIVERIGRTIENSDLRPRDLLDAGQYLYFTGDISPLGRPVLYRYDGQQIESLGPAAPDAANSSIEPLAALFDSLYFTQTERDSTGVTSTKLMRYAAPAPVAYVVDGNAIVNNTLPTFVDGSLSLDSGVRSIAVNGTEPLLADEVQVQVVGDLNADSLDDIAIVHAKSIGGVLFTGEEGNQGSARDVLTDDGAQDGIFAGDVAVQVDPADARFGAGAYQFGNFPSTIQLTNTRDLGSAFTLAGWVKPADGTVSRLFSSYDGSGSVEPGELILDFEPNGTSAIDGLRFVLHTDQGSGTITAFPAVSFADGQYHHLAATYDHGSVRLYLDGELKGSGLLPTGPVSLLRDLRVGEDLLGGVDEQLQGFADDLLVVRRGSQQPKFRTWSACRRATWWQTSCAGKLPSSQERADRSAAPKWPVIQPCGTSCLPMVTWKPTAWAI